MKQTPNYNFPILEAGDKYIKDYHNDAFNVIDTELKATNDKINTLDNVEGSILETKQDLENTKNEILNTKNEILKEKKENILREKLGILSQVETMKQSELLINTAELIDLKQSESNYISSVDNLVAIIDKLLEGGRK